MIMNYKTVISLGEKNFEYIISKFNKLLDAPRREGIINAHKAGFFFGYSYMIRFIFVEFMFYISSIFIYKYNDNPKDSYTGVQIIFLAAYYSGFTLA